MSDYAQLKVQLDSATAEKVKAQAENMGMPEDGVLLMTLLEMGIQDGTVDDTNLMSAQEHLIAMADKIEADGVNEADVSNLVAKIRILSAFATTQLVPVDPY